MVKSKKETEKKENVEQTKSDLLWEQIKNLTLDLYALPNQILHKHVERVNVSPDLLHLRLKSPAVLPALEDALKDIKLDPGMRFDISQQRDFVVLSVVLDPSLL